MSSKNRKKRKAAYKAKAEQRKKESTARSQYLSQSRENEQITSYKLSETWKKAAQEDVNLESYMEKRESERHGYLSDEIAEVTAAANATLGNKSEILDRDSRRAQLLRASTSTPELKHEARDMTDEQTTEFAKSVGGVMGDCPRCKDMNQVMWETHEGLLCIRCACEMPDLLTNKDDKLNKGHCPQCGLDDVYLHKTAVGNARLCQSCTNTLKKNSSSMDITPAMQRAIDMLDRQTGPMDGSVDDNDSYMYAVGEGGEIIGFPSMTEVGGNDDLPAWSKPADKDSDDDLICVECHKELIECECYDEVCEYCGGEDDQCDCYPGGKHRSFLDEDCDCMTDEEKYDRIFELEEVLLKRREQMFGFGNVRGTSKDNTLPVQQTSATISSTVWCREHQRSNKYCTGLSHTLPHNPDGVQEFGPTTGWCMEHRQSAEACKTQAHIGWCKQHCQTLDSCVTMWHAPLGSIIANGESVQGNWTPPEKSGGGVIICQNTKLPAATCKCANHAHNATPTIDNEGRVNANIPAGGQTQMFANSTNQPGPAPNQGSKESNYKWEKHDHFPQQVIDGKTWGIWCGKATDVEYSVGQCNDEFDLLINLTGRSIKGRDRHIIPIASMKKWETGPIQTPEMILDWPDFGIIDWPLEFWLELMTHIEENDMNVCVFCVGGHGRTGTAICAMLIVGLNYTALQAVQWLRKNYCKKVVESKAQVDYLYNLEDAFIAYNEEKEAAEKKAKETPIVETMN